MANLNKILLIGNLTRDPEIRTTQKGTAVADLGLAVNRKVQDGNGGWKDETTFVDVTLWGSSATNAGKYLSKGRAIFVEGRLQLDAWEDKETGQKRSRIKIIGETVQFLPSGKASQSTTNNNPEPSPVPRDQYIDDGSDVDEDIPF